MPTVTPGFSAYGAFPSGTVAGANRTTVQTPFSNQVTAGFDFRKARMEKHRLNRTIQTQITTAVVNPSVAVATDAIQTVRFNDRVPATLVNGKRTGRIRRVAVDAILTLGSLVGGTGYTNGSYTNVPLVRTTGSGTQLLASGAAADITVAGGIVTVCTLVAARAGEGYTAGTILAGTGFTITAATVGVG
jgi:hypothetical protein